jgi:hypothetical protein
MMSYLQMTNWLPYGGPTNVLAAVVFVAFIIWSLIWKGIALWKAGRLGQKVWFIVLLIVNTVGILDIIYIYSVAKKREKAGIQSQM